MVIFGAGYGFEMLAGADWWLQVVGFIYWGDIDTHGFAILDQLRRRFGHVEFVPDGPRNLAGIYFSVGS